MAGVLRAVEAVDAALRAATDERGSDD